MILAIYFGAQNCKKVKKIKFKIVTDSAICYVTVEPSILSSHLVNGTIQGLGIFGDIKL